MKLGSLLFVKINRLVGKYSYLDLFGKIGAEFLVIAMLGYYVSASLILNWPNWHEGIRPIGWLMAAGIIGWLINIGIGFFVGEPRPAISDEKIKLLFKPMTSWKSFPSDHALAAFLMLFLAFLFQLPLAGLLLPMALWVAWGRVFSGVHYPIDILGGFLVATLLSFGVYLFIHL